MDLWDSLSRDTSARTLARSGWVFVLLIALEVALAAILITRFIPEPPPPEPGAPDLVIIQDGDGPLQGDVAILLENEDPEGVVIWVADGLDPYALPTNQGQATWATTQVTNGPYTLEARRGDEVVASREVDVQNARQEATTTAAVVGATTAIAAGGSALGSSLASQAALTAAQIGKESLIAVGEDQMAMRSKKGKKRLASRVAFFLVLLLIFLFFAFEELEAYRVSVYLEALPIAGGVSAAFVALAIGAEYLLGLASRVKTRIRFLGSGAISLAISSVGFRTPFGIPGYVEEVGDEGEGGESAGETEDDEQPHVEGIRAIASTSVLVALLMPFLWIGYRWNYDIAEQGLEIALIALATSALPIKPLPGHDIWGWRKAVAIGYAIGAFLLYFAWALAFLPDSVLYWTGAFGLLFYTGTFIWLRARSAVPHPPWYLRAVDEFHAMQGDLRKLMPAAGRRASQAIERATLATAAGLDRFFKAVVAAYVKWKSARDARLARQELQRLAGQRAGDMERIMDELEGLDDDADYTTIDADGNTVTRRVGDLRDEACKARLYAALGKDAPGVVTIAGEPDRIVEL